MGIYSPILGLRDWLVLVRTGCNDPFEARVFSFRGTRSPSAVTWKFWIFVFKYCYISLPPIDKINKP